MKNDAYIEEALEAATQRALDNYGPLSDEMLAEIRVKHLFRLEMYAESNLHHHECESCGAMHECHNTECCVSADFVGEAHVSC